LSGDTPSVGKTRVDRPTCAKPFEAFTGSFFEGNGMRFSRLALPSGPDRRLRVLGLLAAAVILGAADQPADTHAGEPLPLARYAMTFDEPFDTLDVSAWGPGSRWIAHTPWNGDFGDARFIDPGKGEPYTVSHGILRIEMKRKDGHWQSGLLSSADRLGHGFTQSGGYFEVRAKLPGGPGVWPAFWLGSNAVGAEPVPEIDVLEYYGRFPDSYRVTTHVWKEGKGVSGESIKVDVPKASLETTYHSYGVSIDANNVIYYLDRREVARQPGKPEYLKPMFMMVNLAAGGGWPIEGMADPSIMEVDYVRAYRLKH
jgi:beta-glucanase (GH16 family)